MWVLSIELWTYAAFVGMCPSTFSMAAVPGYGAVVPLGMAQGRNKMLEVYTWKLAWC